MSRFFSDKYRNLVPYTPGEQPKNKSYIKLNTNECPYPPSEKAMQYAGEKARTLQLYPDPTCSLLTEKIADMLGVGSENVLVTNGSDEILNFVFMAFCTTDAVTVFPDITYGFYSVFAELNGVKYQEIPLRDDFTINPEDYIGINKNIFIANPNAPSAIAISQKEIERIVSSNPDNIVVIDEAYVDFGTESAVSLTKRYDNLIVTQTFSKSRSMAGARLGFGVGNSELIKDLNTIKYSTNPYNINSMTMAAGLGVLEDEAYTRENCRKIIETREFVKAELSKLDFSLTDSKTNFVFAKHNRISGAEIYEKLRENGILVRHFNGERIKDYNRITIGTKEEMSTFINVIKRITEG